MLETAFDDEDVPVPTYETQEEQMDAFVERFIALQEEALTFGITTVCVMGSHDRLSNQTHRAYVRRGSFYEALGLLVAITEEIQNEE